MVDIGFTPVFDRILVEREIQDKTKGGVILPDSVAKRHAATKGKIVKVGHTADPAIRAMVGKEVYFARFSGDWLALGDTDRYFILTDEDVLGVAEDIEISVVDKEDE